MNFFRRLFFNLWYLRNPPWNTGVSPPELIEFFENHSPGRALDLGCGTGTNVITLAQHGWQVTGVDFAARAIRIARRRVHDAGVKANLLVNDVTDLRRISGYFDLILDIGCFHGLPSKGKSDYVQNLEKLLAPGGIFLMYGFFRNLTESGPGLLKTDLEILSSSLELLKRRDGTERRGRPSVWMTFQKPE